MVALMALARMFQSKCLIEIDNSEKILVQKLITGLSEQKVNLAKDVLIIGKLYKEGGLLVKNLHEAVKWYYLATQLSESDKEYFEMSKEFEALLNFKDYNSEEKTQIIQGVINLADEKSEPPQMKVISRVLGDIYNAGILTEHDPIEAIRWYEKSAKLSNFKAMCGLGSIYEAGISENINLAKAIEWYIQSAQGDNQDAIKRLTDLCNSSDLDPILKSRIEAWQIEHLSNMEKDNSLLPEKNSGILDFYPKDPNTMYELGKQYQEKGCKEQDCLQAAYWFRKAAKKNHPEAAFELAKMYESGMLGEKTRPVSIEFYKQALKCYKLMLEKQPPYNCDISDKIGIIYSKLGKTEKSLAYQEKAFKIRQGLDITDHQDPIGSLVPDYISELPLADKITCQVHTNLLGGVVELP
jgi:TPR repeat protein